MSFKDKVAIVTGAASGIGKSCSLSFAEKGVKVIVVDLNKKGAEKTTLEIQRKGSEAIFIKADVSKKEDVESIVTITENNFGKIDILVNCAGICQIRNIEDITEQEWDKVMSVNLKGTFLMCQSVLKEMKNIKGGKL